MCFGAEASFISSGLLLTIGIASIRKTCSKKEIPLASLPIILSAHQFIEGLLWLTLLGKIPQSFQFPMTLIFLIVAFSFWPTYSPISIFCIESNPKRKLSIFSLIIFGIVVSTFLFYYLLVGPFSASIVNCSIYYNHFIPGQKELAILYLLTTFGPYLLSSYKKIVHIGILNVIFCFISYYLYSQTFISVWCFFAALLSIAIYFFFRGKSIKKL